MIFTPVMRRAMNLSSGIHPFRNTFAVVAVLVLASVHACS